MMKKPRLSLGNSDEATPVNAKPRLGVKSDDRSSVTTTKSTASAVLDSVLRILKTIMFFLIAGVILFAVLYSSLSATLMFTSPSEDSQTERVWVARGAFPGGLVPSGSYVYGSANSSESSSLITKAGEGYVGASKHFVAEVIAGPHAKVSVDDAGRIMVNDVATAYNGKVSNQMLNKQYLAVCMEGSCEKGSIINIPEANIYGEAKGVIDILKFTFNNYGAVVESRLSDAV